MPAPFPYVATESGDQATLVVTCDDGTEKTGTVMKFDAAYYQMMADHIAADPAQEG